ncbi:MAG: hypothetical protein D6723_09770 [Acidobacteria bacterium]|nr:MAG: hypothetical protein D6723_09770 [Acidobacteriota bacterium]
MENLRREPAACVSSSIRGGHRIDGRFSWKGMHNGRFIIIGRQWLKQHVAEARASWGAGRPVSEPCGR